MSILRMIVLLTAPALAPGWVSADEVLDKKYPKLANPKIPNNQLPSGVTPVQLAFQPPHENLKAFEITEDKRNFGVNGMPMQLLMHDRISAFYMATYYAEAMEEGIRRGKVASE